MGSSLIKRYLSFLVSVLIANQPLVVEMVVPLVLDAEDEAVVGGWRMFVDDVHKSAIVHVLLREPASNLTTTMTVFICTLWRLRVAE